MCAWGGGGEVVGGEWGGEGRVCVGGEVWGGEGRGGGSLPSLLNPMVLL